MTTSLDVIDSKGKKVGSVDLPAETFDVQTNVPLIHQVVVAQRAAARQGTHNTLRRGEVSGAGRKPFKQKGTGRARQGSIRAPQMTGGGIVHGPHPRDYSQRTPKKMIAAALRGALSDRARGGRIHVIDSLSVGDAPSTKAIVSLLNDIATSKHVLVVLERDDELSYKSVRNIQSVHVLPYDQLNAYDVLVSDDIVFTKGSFDAFVSSKPVKAEVADDSAAEPKAPASKKRVSPERANPAKAAEAKAKKDTKAASKKKEKVSA
jgi:large subunit ribosomal protein L4